MWKNKKQFVSMMLKQDLFEYPLFVLGSKEGTSAANLNGFDIETYSIFNTGVEKVNFFSLKQKGPRCDCKDLWS